MFSKSKKYIIYILSEKRSEIEVLKKSLSDLSFSPLFFLNSSDLIKFLVRRKAPEMVMLSKSLTSISPRDMVLILRKNKKTSSCLIVFFSEDILPEGKDFDLGVDEFFTFKKDNPVFIKTRILNLLVRKEEFFRKEKILKFKGLSVFPESRLVKAGFREIKLANLEFEMLVYFLENRGRIITRNNLMQAVWKQPFIASPRAVDKRIEMLRKKLGRIGKYLRTVFSIGYMLKE